MTLNQIIAKQKIMTQIRGRISLIRLSRDLSREYRGEIRMRTADHRRLGQYLPER